MTKIYRLLLISIIIGLLSLVFAPFAYAAPEDEPTGLSDVQLRVYPEYDDTRLLMILRGQITGVTASADDPVTVRFLIPSTAQMYSAGFFNAQGGYVRGGFTDPTKTIEDPYPEQEVSDIAGWDEITFTIETNRFVVEYYAPIIIGNTDKTIAYEFHFLYPVADLDVVVLEPRASTNFSISPQGTRATGDVFGEDYPLHLYSFTDLLVDEDSPLQFDISYTKSDPRPSVEITDSGSTGLVVGIVLGVLAAVVGGFFLIRFLQTRKARQKLPAKRRPERTSKKKRNRQQFCRQCGKQLDTPTPHCPFCGAKQ
jgi:hypothetical protein